MFAGGMVGVFIVSVNSFSAICNEQTHTLILGTMPGVASLNAHQYYAHSRNAFWPIMLAIHSNSTPDFAIHKALAYEDKITALQLAGYGLWDVLAECERPGSLDSAIKSKSVVMNDFLALMTQYSAINVVAFNGKAAQQLFNRHVMPKLAAAAFDTHSIQWISLPSSSPAMASLNLQQKHQQWCDLLAL